MKKYKKRQKCYCGGYESCELCNPDRDDKRREKKSKRRGYKDQLNKEMLKEAEARSNIRD